MDGSEAFAHFLDDLIVDVDRLCADADPRRAVERADPEATDTVAGPVETPNEVPPISDPREYRAPIGAATVTQAGLTAATVPGARRREAVTDVDQVIDWVIVSGGTSFLMPRGEPAVELLKHPANRRGIRDRVVAVIEGEASLSDNLVHHVPEDVDPDMLLAVMLSLFHVRELARATRLFDELLDRFRAAIALDVAIATFRPRGMSAVMEQRKRDVRRGRNALSEVIAAMVANTRHVEWTHQLWTERLLVRLMDLKYAWQLRQRIASFAGSSPPTPSDLANVRRQEEIATQLAAFEGDISLLQTRIAEGRAQLRAGDLDREGRAAWRAELAIVRSLLQSKRWEYRQLNTELNQLRRDLGPANRALVDAYLAAEQRGVLRAAARAERDEMLTDADRLLAGAVSERLSDGTEDELWSQYQLLLERLLISPRGLGLELFMDSFLKVAQYTERRRDIGIEGHDHGAVQWLTYPGHPDGAVDFNCAAGRVVSVVAPDVLTIPNRLRTRPTDATEYRYASSVATSRVRATTDLQDIFGHIAGALVASRGGRGARSDDMANTFSRYEGNELAPPQIVARQFTRREVTSILVGLLAENLTSIPNASEFDELRARIVDDLETLIVRSRRLPAGTRIFRRGVSAATGRGSLGRFIENLSQREVEESVQTVLAGTSSSPYVRERERIIHRLWRLVVWMRSAGAEAHRHAGSVTVRHVYRAAVRPDLIVEIYHTHMHSVAVRPGQSLRRRARIGLSGMTGNAVNPHVHTEIGLARPDGSIGVILPHEFFPLRAGAAGVAGANGR